MDTSKLKANDKHVIAIREAHQFCEGLRRNPDRAIDMDFQKVLQEKTSLTFDNVLYELGINPFEDTVANILTYPEVSDIKWIVPEIYRKAIKLGFEGSPIWPNITAAVESSKGPSQIVPFINPSNATPEKVGEAETIPLGTLSFGQKTVNTFKVGKGLKMSYELMNYCSLNLLSIYLEDMGIKMGQAVDNLAIDTLINGEQADGSESSPVIGVTTAGAKTYADFLRIFIRAARLGRVYGSILGGETAALATLNLSEFKTKTSGTPEHTLNLKTPVPSSTNYFIHGSIPANQEIFVDRLKALIKLQVQPILLESEKIVSNQTTASYVTTTLGFFKMFKDAAVIMDSSLAFASNGFPAYMDADSLVDVHF